MSIIKPNNNTLSAITALPFNPGISMADQWRWTASFTGNAQPITSNWERNDTSFDKIGTGMTESSGIFTFPETGIYIVNTGTIFQLDSDSRYNEIVIRLSTDGGSNYSSIAYGYAHISRVASSTTYSQAVTEAMFDVTNVSNFKVAINVKIQELKDAETARENLRTSGKTKLKAGQALTDDEITALFG
jgi:hypothetical protein